MLRSFVGATLPLVEALPSPGSLRLNEVGKISGRKSPQTYLDFGFAFCLNFWVRTGKCNLAGSGLSVCFIMGRLFALVIVN